MQIVRADYYRPEHARAIGELLDVYARDPMGGGRPLDPALRDDIARRLAAVPTAFSLLGFHEGRAVALANAFEGLSTFHGRPLVNVHDLVVHPDFRGRGFGRSLLQAVEALAREKGCCKLTLEVLEGNAVARAVYERCGFRGYALDPAMGQALFWEKPLDL